MKIIVETLLRLDSDIVCLQEVDRWPEVQSLLGDRYDGVFAQRTGHKCDGLAVFWKREKFAAVGEKEMLKYDDKLGKDGEHRIALRICLNFLSLNRLVVVAQTHLDYKRARVQGGFEKRVLLLFLSHILLFG